MSLRGIDALTETAVGVLGDSIDYDGDGWNGLPQVMLVTPTYDGGQELNAVVLEADSAAEQLQEISDAFRHYLPVACAYVKRLNVTVEGRRTAGATLAAVVALNGDGGERLLACEVATADDGRDILVPLDGVESGLIPGVFDSFVANALALSQGVRAGEPEGERWERMLTDARGALRR